MVVANEVDVARHRPQLGLQAKIEVTSYMYRMDMQAQVTGTAYQMMQEATRTGNRYIYGSTTPLPPVETAAQPMADSREVHVPQDVASSAAQTALCKDVSVCADSCKRYRT